MKQLKILIFVVLGFVIAIAGIIVFTLTMDRTQNGQTETEQVSSEDEQKTDRIVGQEAESTGESDPASDRTAMHPIEPDQTESDTEQTGKKQETEQTMESTEDTEEMIYVAIGDSITRGFGLASTKERFSFLLREKLEEDTQQSWTEYNYGVDGQTSDELLDNLQHDRISHLQDADLITVCIGANDMLQPVESLFLVGYQKLWEILQVNADNYYENLESIMGELRRVNPDCRIIFMTIYNPYKGIDFTEGDNDTSLDSLADDVVTELNSIIVERASDLGYEVADVYQAFQETEEYVLNAYVNTQGINLDVHTNSIGHQLIADVFFDVITHGETP